MTRPELPFEVVEELKTAFKRFDKDSDGQLSFEEFREVFLLVDKSLSNKQQHIYFRSLEPNSNNCIGFSRFVQLLTRGDQVLSPKCVTKSLFKEFDTDNDGFVTFDEFKLIARTFDSKHSHWKLKKAFGKVDKDRNGLISPEEMEQAMEKYLLY